jgi:methylmalonyl-CoA mutase N-terminal domain/subunit
MTIKQEYKRWRENIYKKSTARYPERKDRFATSSGIEIPEISLPAKSDQAIIQDLGFPGEYPFTRGVKASMYRGRFLTIRQ